MELLTSSYARWQPGDGSPVVISLTTPRWRPEAASWPRLWEATPRYAYFRAAPPDFDAAYVAQLDAYGPQRIARRLHEIAQTAYEAPSVRLVLICFEAPEVAETQCHRRTFAAWALRTTGERIDELDAAGSAR